ncbi:hypothetical protein CALVIDRAFT_366608 [Calocera viscosa TUFC12733]|uniref:Uncharacterized protein n=1 Tax=Calocera viscosa (strain TUFC12733) TaxID=1330018 RepID=A0A167H0V9_CALVF|nr:hypothetical protein CALVIDRAFT_366608 [Calocera viscosa TUFC12733]
MSTGVGECGVASDVAGWRNTAGWAGSVRKLRDVPSIVLRRSVTEVENRLSFVRRLLLLGMIGGTGFLVTNGRAGGKDTKGVSEKKVDIVLRLPAECLAALESTLPLRPRPSSFAAPGVFCFPVHCVIKGGNCGRSAGSDSRGILRAIWENADILSGCFSSDISPYRLTVGGEDSISVLIGVRPHQ